MPSDATIPEQTSVGFGKSNPANSFWQRRLIGPISQQLKQGVTPDKLAQSVAWGVMLGVFPILGTTMMLCGLAGLVLRLNHIIIQTVNWLIYPLQIILIIPFLRLGNILFGIDQFPLSISEITALFEADFWGSLQDMGWLALRGVVAWVLVATPVILIMRWSLTPVFSRLAKSVSRKPSVS